MNALAGAVVKFLTWLGTILFIRKGAKDEVRAETAEKTVETIVKAHAPVTSAGRERLRARYKKP